MAALWKRKAGLLWPELNASAVYHTTAVSHFLLTVEILTEVPVAVASCYFLF